MFSGCCRCKFSAGLIHSSFREAERPLRSASSGLRGLRSKNRELIPKIWIINCAAPRNRPFTTPTSGLIYAASGDNGVSKAHVRQIAGRANASFTEREDADPGHHVTCCQ